MGRGRKLLRIEMSTISNHGITRAHLPQVDHHKIHRRFDAPDGMAADDYFLSVLNDAHQRLKAGPLTQSHVNDTMDDVFDCLRTRRMNVEENQWSEFIEKCRCHPCRELVHEDPFTFRAFSKPRGYAGDAEMIDFIYAREERWPLPEATPLGRLVFNYTTLAPASAGVRARRGYVADMIDQLAEEVREPHVLSIASGHLREAGLCSAVKRGRLGRFVALDTDKLSLVEVDRQYGWYGVETVAASFRSLVANKLDLGQFDFVYSTGLFDYLGQPTARRLLTTMFQMLRPGGRLLVANFLPNIRDVGYMETYMDWKLVYRTRHDMVDLTMEIPEHEIRHISLFAEENQNIILLKVTKN